MMNTKMMNDEMLVKVTGGDNGDARKDTKEDRPWYAVGDALWVYITPIHFLRALRYVVDRYYGAEFKAGGEADYFCWHYKVKDDITGLTSWVTADDIES